MTHSSFPRNSRPQRRSLTITAAALAILASLTVPASAHFIWVEIVTGPQGQPQLRVAFSELGEAGDAELVEHARGTKASVIDGKATAHELKLQPLLADGAGYLAADVDSATTATTGVMAQIDCAYGLFKRGETASLLHYYGTYCRLPDADSAAAAKPRADLPLQVTAARENAGLTLTVLWDSKPVAESQVVIVGPDEIMTEATSDAEGKVRLEKLQPGTYRIRARHIRLESGQHNGEAYTQESHYATLTLFVGTA